jgi:hypothetical protein
MLLLLRLQDAYLELVLGPKSPTLILTIPESSNILGVKSLNVGEHPVKLLFEVVVLLLLRLQDVVEDVNIVI